MKKLDRYILKKYLGAVFFTVALFIIIAVVIDLSEKVDDFLEHEADFYNIVFNYYVNFVPFIVFFLSPIFIFISVIFFTSKMASRSELVAILSSGVSFYRILFVPYMIGASILAGIQWYANHHFVPLANEKRIAFEEEFIRKKTKTTEFNIHLQVEKSLYLTLESYNNTDSTGRNFTLERFEGSDLKERILAQRVDWKNGRWELKKWKRRTLDGMKESISSGEKMDTVFSFKPEDFGQYAFMREAMTTERLKAYIAKEEARGADNLDFFRVELYRRNSVPVATFILTIIGFALASRKTRGGMGLHLLAGIALSALYILMMQFSVTFATNADMSALLAVWLPNIFFGILGLILLIKAPK